MTTHRKQIEKLRKGHSTKAERRFSELLKELHIPFRTKVKLEGYEIDFLVGEFAIEIDSHEQNPLKNVAIVRSGYTPFHFQNFEISNQLIEWLLKIHNRFFA